MFIFFYKKLYDDKKSGNQGLEQSEPHWVLKMYSPSFAAKLKPLLLSSR